MTAPGIRAGSRRSDLRGTGPRGAGSRGAGSRRAARHGGLPRDLLGLAVALLLAAVWILARIPVLRVVGGLILPIPVQGLALALAVLPTAARKGLFATAGAMGVAATVCEVVAVDRCGIGVTATSVTLTCAAVGALALVAAGLRRSRLHLRLPAVRVGPSWAIGGTAVAVTAAAVLVGRGIPDVNASTYSAVAFSGPLARVHGVLSTDVGQPVPLSVGISNGESAGQTYVVSVERDGHRVLAPVRTTVGAGTTRTLALGSVVVPDGCLHRFTVSARSGHGTYLLTLYAAGAHARCLPSTT